MEHPVLQTERLTLRPLATDDADALLAIFNDEVAMRYWSGFHADTLEGARKLIPGIIAGPKTHHWALWRAEDRMAIGYVGFIGNDGVPGFGYALRRDCWGQGLVPEACRAAITWGFDGLGLDRVELWIHEDNERSVGVARKLGFREVGAFFRGTEPRSDDAYSYRCFGMLARDWPGISTPTTRPLLEGIEPVFLVHDVRATAEYYRDTLGFEIGFFVGDPPTHAGVSRSLWTPNRATVQLSQAEPGSEIRPTGWTYFWAGHHLDALHEELQKRGARFTRELATMPWGLREFQIEDCNGYTLRFGCNP